MNEQRDRWLGRRARRLGVDFDGQVRSRWLILGLLALVGAGSSCGDAKTSRCSFDLYCPIGTVCNDTHEICVTPQQLEACTGIADGESCTLGEATNGTCSGGVCFVAECGNGLVDVDEVCDDGNLISGDGCRSDCQSEEACGNQLVDVAVGEQCDCGDDPSALPTGCRGVNGDGDSQCSLDCRFRYCSNGAVDPGESCDDGNLRSGDGCSADCRSDEVCGNSVIDFAVGETCDDGNAVYGDGCSPKCVGEVCGNGLLDAGEACDDGNYDSGDGCRGDCLSAETCGNGVVDLATGELCDCGSDATNLPQGCAAINGDPLALCSDSCNSRFCGNGVVDPGELCDDNNATTGDGCSPDCRSIETCGNGRFDYAVGETCDCGVDPGNLPRGCSAVNGDASGECSNLCQSIYCGNGVIDTLEVCDDGNLISGDGCAANCVSDETCGNGIPDFPAGELCDCGTDPADLPNGCLAVNGAPGSHCSASCLRRFCGNGILDPGELCDDGNQLSGDGCSASCLSDETCGNGIPDFAVGEGCDDGNTTSGDGCSASCLFEICGNSILDAAEVCDDGNNTSGDGCRSDCRSDETCGNAIADLAAGESCDDGNTDAGDGCGPTCQIEACGNGILEPLEVCDDGNHSNGDGCSADCLSNETCGNEIADLGAGETCDDGNNIAGDGCSPSCHLERCGNGTLDPGEVCDDGNHTPGDGCSADCISDETCGNGVVDVAVGESCDDGNAIVGDGCNTACSLESCGNGFTEPGEVCDDGNNTSGDGCSANCISDESCGNSIVDVLAGETCDDGDVLPGDGCSAICLLEQCGNGALELGEVCDDGNNLSGDGCSADCLSIEVCGNGYVDVAAGETCDDNNTVAGDGCNGSCVLERCGNGVLDLGEVCDDGNNTPGDGCGPSCLSNEACGNGFVDYLQGEQCDDGNTATNDGCGPTCLLESCGNAYPDPGEVCDDGNLVSGDGCRGDCLSDESCGNGIIDAVVGESCDDGNAIAGDGCGLTCVTEYCGNGVVDALLGEVCDDGNNTAGDGCNPTCTSDESCGNGILDAGEQCDDGNVLDCDGCNASCVLSTGCGLGLVCCAGGCLAEDENNCGTCGNACAGGVYCRNGTCMEPGVIVITEFMPNAGDISDSNGEFIEVYNPTALPINLIGWVLHDEQANNDPHTINAEVIVPAGGFAVLARNSNNTQNGGLSADYHWTDPATYALSSNEEIFLDAVVDTGTGTQIITVDWLDYSNAWYGTGVSASLDPAFYDHIDNDLATNWCETSSGHPLPLSPNSLATPNQTNDPCP